MFFSDKFLAKTFDIACKISDSNALGTLLPDSLNGLKLQEGVSSQKVRKFSASI